MADGPRAWRRWRVELAAAALLLAPVCALLAAGAIWLWEQGWLLWWLLAAVLAAATAWGSLRLRHGASRRAPAVAEPADEPTVTDADPTWAPRELAAWESVRRQSSAADGTLLERRRRMFAVAQRTIETVARHYHPERADPALQFTLPEMLALSERVSARLRTLLLEQVPLSDRLKAGLLLRAWGYRPLLTAGLEHGRKAYTFWRFARAVNPLNALVAEVRDYFVDDLLGNLNANVRRRIVRIWIEEVGRAAIELYSGRLRLDASSLASAAETVGLAGVATPAAPPGPLRLLIAGRTKAGKSTLVNALLGELSAGVDVLPLTAEYEGYELRHEGRPSACLIDSPGIDEQAGAAELVKRAFACDLVLWVVPAHRPDRALDRAALDALRARFAAEPARKAPPVIVVASHVDRLSPMREWAPPYDVANPAMPKAHSIRGALDAIADDLAVPVEMIVPMRLDTTPAYNIDVLWLRLETVMDEAQRARWVRVLRTAIGRRRWRQSWQQLVGAGRMVGRLVKG